MYQSYYEENIGNVMKKDKKKICRKTELSLVQLITTKATQLIKLSKNKSPAFTHSKSYLSNKKVDQKKSK